MVSSYARQILNIRKSSVSPSSSDATSSTTGTAESMSNTDNVVARSLECPYNPCFELGFEGCGNPYSAIFKIRICSECGRHCTKLEGYNKELREDKVENMNVKPGQTTCTPIIEPTTKVYYHKWCSQIKEYRQEHAKKYRRVMHVLSVSHYRALVKAHRVRDEADAEADADAAPSIAHKLSKKISIRNKKKQKHTTLVNEQQLHHHQPLSRLRPIVIPDFVNFVKEIQRQSQLHHHESNNNNNSLPMVIDHNWSETKGKEREREREREQRDVQQQKTTARMIHKLKERVSKYKKKFVHIKICHQP